MTPDWNEVAALAAVAASATAITAIIIEGRRARFRQRVEILLRFEERFDSPVMRLQRKVAVDALKNGRYDDAEPVLDFFETVGLLVAKGSLDLIMVQNSFLSWIHLYYYTSRDHIAAERAKSPDTWYYLTTMYERMLRLKAAKLHVRIEQLRPSETAIRQFYMYEGKDIQADVARPKVSTVPG
jgi:hypothetical protein